MHDLIVLGGGPAGLTATMYAIQKRLDVLMISRDLGGKTKFHLRLPSIERHMVINGDEVISRFVNEMKYLEFATLMDNIVSVESTKGGYVVNTTGLKRVEGRALIIATGAKPQIMNVPGERDFMGHGLCYSAINYAQLMIGRNVVLVGDGNLALRGAAELALAAHHVTLIASQPDDLDSPTGKRLRGLQHVEFLVGYEVKEVRGDQYARSILVSGPDGIREIYCDAIFVEKELVPISQMVAHLVELDPRGHIVINLKNETSATGIFAAGDVTNTYTEQVLVSIGEGAKAALSAYNYLLQHDLLKAPSFMSTQAIC